MNYKKEIVKVLKQIFPDADMDGAEENIAVTPEGKEGDYAFPCFKLSKALRKAPNAIAAEAVERFNDPSGGELIEAITADGGYINFTLNRGAFTGAVLKEIGAAGDAFGKSGIGKGKTVCIDYSSVNIAKPFHMGHLYNTALGGSLYRIYRALGYKVVGINHLGDYGTQFGNLITAYKLWGSDAELNKDGIHALLRWYVKFHAESEKDGALNEQGREWFRRIEAGDAEAKRIFNRFKEITLLEVKGVYEDLGVQFDSWDGESFFTDKIPAVVDELKEKKLLIESEGAQVVDLTEFKLPPALILKKDGASLYITRDLAAAEYRKKTYGFDKCLYVVAYQQNLHFQQLFSVLKLMDKEWCKDCVHVAYGMVSMPEGAMSTRKGQVVFLKDVLKQAVDKTLATINEKSPDLKDKETVARRVGTGAVIYSVLSNAKIKDIVFDYDKVLNFEGETGPYIMYTHARASSVLAKAAGIGQGHGDTVPDLSCRETCPHDLKADQHPRPRDLKLAKKQLAYLRDDEAFALIKLLNKYPAVVAEAAETYEPSLITRLLIDIAQTFNKFYFAHKIITGNKDESAARLNLTAAVKQVLKNGLNLILIEAPDKM